jgi:hypothetical protein
MMLPYLSRLVVVGEATGVPRHINPLPDWSFLVLVKHDATQDLSYSGTEWH